MAKAPIFLQTILLTPVVSAMEEQITFFPEATGTLEKIDPSTTITPGMATARITF